MDADDIGSGGGTKEACGSDGEGDWPSGASP